MKIKSYQVFYTNGTVQHKTRVYKLIGNAKKNANRIAINKLNKHIHIVGYDEMNKENFREVIK